MDGDKDGIVEHIVEGKFDIAKPKWTLRERAQRTWYWYIMPLWCAILLAVGMLPRQFLVIFAVVYWWFHTWIMTTSLMWYIKFTDCVSDAWAKGAEVMSKNAFEVGRKIGREEAGAEDKPWLT